MPRKAEFSVFAALAHGVELAQQQGAQHHLPRQAKLAERGFDVVGGSAEDYGRKIRSEIELWSRIVRENPIKLD